MAIEVVDKGSLLMNGSEQDLFPSQTELLNYSTKIFFDELITGDEIVIRVYDLDEETLTEKIYRIDRVTGLQSSSRLVNWIPSSSYRVTVQQVTGVFRTITWALYKA